MAANQKLYKNTYTQSKVKPNLSWKGDVTDRQGHYEMDGVSLDPKRGIMLGSAKKGAKLAKPEERNYSIDELASDEEE